MIVGIDRSVAHDSMMTYKKEVTTTKNVENKDLMVKIMKKQTYFKRCYENLGNQVLGIPN